MGSLPDPLKRRSQIEAMPVSWLLGLGSLSQGEKEAVSFKNVEKFLWVITNVSGAMNS